MLREPRRLLSSSIAIILGVAFVATALMLGDALNASTRSTAGGLIRDADYVVSSPGVLSLTAFDRVKALPGVTEARATGSTGFTFAQDGGVVDYYLIQNTPELTSSTTLVAGRLPKQDGEAAISEVIATGRGLQVGDELTATDGDKVKLKLVGVVRIGADTAASKTPLLLVTDAQLLRYTEGYGEFYLKSNLDQATLATSLSTIPGDELTLRPASEVITERTAELLRGANTMTTLLLAFAAIALFTASLVIANTFSILVAQRSRQLSLLRCLGATRSQVFGSVIGEAFWMACLASAIGVGLGLGLAQTAVSLSQGTNLELPPLVASPTSIAVPILVGIVVTVLASLVPARRATRIAPLAALRTIAVQEAERPGLAKLVTGGVLVLLGAAGLVAAATWQPLRAGSNTAEIPGYLLVGIGSGLVCFIGVLLLAGLLVPAMANLARPLLLRVGVSGELASDNAARNPRRAAATASALLIGTTLITMMSVGAATAETSLSTQLDSRYPVDAVIDGDSLDPLVPVLAKVPEVARTTVVEASYLEYQGANGVVDFDAIGINDQDAAVTRNSVFSEGLGPDTIVLPRSEGVPAGTMLRVSGDRGSVELRVVLASRRGTPALLTADRLAEISQPRQQLWLRFTDDAEPIAAAAAAGKAAATVIPGIRVDSAAAGRADLRGTLDLALGVVVGLLAVAVVIAIVGISNTLGLSVLERTRESGLLRALGLSRRQLRHSIGLEAVLLSLVAAILGLILGSGFAIAGSYTIMPLATPVIITVPWDRVALIGTIAVAAGWLASILPAFRAARVSPAVALSYD